MKHLLFAAVLITAAIPAFATDVGVSISVGQPGFYGQIDIGGYPPPPVIYREPRVIERIAVSRPPVYLHVPPGHARNWRKHCREYNACGERVYFVQDSWYDREYVPRYQKHHGDRGDDRGDEMYDRHDERHDNGRGNGHGNGRGHGH